MDFNPVPLFKGIAFEKIFCLEAGTIPLIRDFARS